MPAIVVDQLRKSYGTVEAVADVSFTVEQGEIFALLGPNGAGKTTTVEVLEGFRRRDAGEVSVLGFDPEKGGAALRERIGIVLQSAGLPKELTVAEVVACFASYYPRSRPPQEVIAWAGLESKLDARVKTLSGGQRRRLDLALGIVGNPDLLFLDEPTTGFDPAARRKAWALIEGLRAAGTTILLTTHYMEEAQKLAHRVLVIAAGRIIGEGDPASLGGRDLGQAVISFRLPAELRLEDLPDEVRREAEEEESLVVLRTTTPTRMLSVLTGWAAGLGRELPGLQVVRPTLEEAYLELTGQEQGDG